MNVIMKNKAVVKGVMLVVLLIIVTVLLRYTGIARRLDLEGLRALISGFGLWGPLAYIFIYSVAPALLFPGTPLTVAGGIIFGPVAGSIYTAIGATIGASVSFLIARYMARGLVVKLLKESNWKSLDEKVEKHGWKIVAFTRLIPLFPFNFLNYAFGLTNIKFSHYVITTFIFMLPAIIAFVVFSSSLLDLLRGKISTEFLIGLILVIIVSAIPLVYKKIKH